jgi:hypothetical protein
MRSTFCLLILASLLSSPLAVVANAQQQGAAKTIQPSSAAPAPLTSDDVLAMLDAELPTEAIVAKIKASRATLDTSPDALQRLRDAGASEELIAAMLPPRVTPSSVEVKAGQPNVPAPVKVPRGVRVELEMAHTIDSLTTRTGDLISLRVVNPVVVEGVTVVAVGATATARVVRAERNGHFGRAGRITWELKEVTAVDGTRVPLAATGHEVGDSKGAKVAAVMALSVLSPAALAVGFKRGENAVVPEGKRYEATVLAESIVNAASRR